MEKPKIACCKRGRDLSSSAFRAKVRRGCAMQMRNTTPEGMESARSAVRRNKAERCRLFVSRFVRPSVLREEGTSLGIVSHRRRVAALGEENCSLKVSYYPKHHPKDERRGYSLSQAQCQLTPTQ